MEGQVDVLCASPEVVPKIRPETPLWDPLAGAEADLGGPPNGNSAPNSIPNILGSDK